MKSLIEELGVPEKHLKETCKQNRHSAVVHKSWLKSLIKHLKLIEFITKPGEIWPSTEEDMDSSWMNIFISTLNKKNCKAIPLPRIRSLKEEEPLLYPQLMQYIAHTNHVGLWKDAYKKYCAPKQKKETLISLTDYNKVLRDVICRIYGCPIVNTCDPNLSMESSEQFEVHLNIMPVVCAVETTSAIFLLHIPHLQYNLNDCVTFSPAILENSYTKSLFIVYQLLSILKSLHERSLTLGEVSLDDIFLNKDMWLYVFPQIESNLFVKESLKTRKSTPIQDCQRVGHMMNYNLECQCCGLQTYDKVRVDEQSLDELCHLWIFGQISNFTYISALNRLSGRVLGDPNCHYVFPWVSDFTSRCGKNFRDLKKSKYRLNKGDHQLDLTYNNGQSQVPHHVSDVLSPITYYVYTARRTPASVLCQNVRTVWVPAEYPSSIQRMQEWTPDECIPEFYSDPSIFRSVHDDMEDLALPPWASGPEDFVEKHRRVLESSNVSEKLHHWIDLTFGCKLSGDAAVKARNVCLNLVDGHENLTKSGLVQLFSHPHPPRYAPSPYWAKVPPKVSAVKSSIRQRRTHRRNSSSTVDPVANGDDEPGLPRPPSRSRSSLLEEASGGGGKPSRSPGGGGSPRLTDTPDGDAAVVRLPRDYRPEAALEALERRHAFFARTFAQNACRPDGDHLVDGIAEELQGGVVPQVAEGGRDELVGCDYAEVISKRRVKELKVLGCLIVEIFMAKQLKSLGGGDSTLDRRVEKCVAVARHSEAGLPPCISHVVDVLLRPNDNDSTATAAYPPVTDLGLPTPSVHLLSEPLLHCALPLPPHLPHAHALLSTLRRFDAAALELDALLPGDAPLRRRLADAQVAACASRLTALLDAAAHDVATGVAMPHVERLMGAAPTAVLAAWLLFEPAARALGPSEASRRLVPPLLRLYEEEGDAGRRTHLRKVARLYHHSFLLGLMVRLGLERFLDKFVGPLVEAVGGRRDQLGDAGDVEDGGETPSKEEATEEEEDQAHPLVSQTAAATLTWLSHRLGPLLTARHLSRNLLKMLALCYVGGAAALLPTRPSLGAAALFPSHPSLGAVSATGVALAGDAAAAGVLDCLAAVAALYGERLVLHQYVPYAAEAVQMGGRRLTANIEGGMVAGLVLVKHVVPCFSDVVLMEQLQDVLLKDIIHPIVRLLGSTEHVFPSGHLARNALARKYLDVIYVLSIRIGSDMTKKHLVVPALQSFFMIFDRVCTDEASTEPTDVTTPPPTPTRASPTEETALRELRDAFTPALARAAYAPFARLVGADFLEAALGERVAALCRTGEGAAGEGWPSGPPRAVAASDSIGSNVALVGNRIDVREGDVGADVDADLLGLVRNRVESSTRHLRGNWLAYWEYEIGRSEKDRAFDFKQIALQTFAGHTQSVKCIYTLDNENSFVSGSRDKTVKLWSLRSQGDGSTTSSCQWTYAGHKKSILSISFVESLRLVASCDGGVHVWDPFMGANLGNLESAKNVPVNVLKSMPAPSTSVFAATTDGTIKIIDTRLMDYVQELKVGLNPSPGLIRCLASAPSGRWLAAGHSSGVVTVLDARTGLVVATWRAHDGEVLQLCAHGDGAIVSTGLDQAVSVWGAHDGKFGFHLRGTSEPVHCLRNAGDGLVTGTTANRVGVHATVAPDAAFRGARLRPDALRGLLTAMDFLPLNRLLLIGSDTGNIHLVC